MCIKKILPEGSKRREVAKKIYNKFVRSHVDFINVLRQSNKLIISYCIKS